MFRLLFLPFVFASGLRNNDKHFIFTLNNIIQGTNKPSEIFKNKCVIKLIEESINQLGSTYMFMADGEPHEKLLHILQMNFIHSYFTEPEYPGYSTSDSYYNLLIFGSKFELRDVIEKKKPIQDTKFFIHVKNYEEAIEKFEILWNYRLVNVVATFVENSTVYYYTYFPYCSRHCGRVGKPFLLAKCDISSGVFTSIKKLYPIKVYDLHKCPVRITFTQNIPASYYNIEGKLTGWEIDLMNEILKRINGVPNYKMLQSKKKVYTTTNGYSRLVEKSEIGAGLAISLKGLVKTDFCMYGMSLCATWIVPKKEDSPYSADFLVKVFPPGTWILLFLTYFVMASAIEVHYKLGYFNVLFKLLPFLLGTTTRTKRASKRLGMLWLWFCVMMNAIYQSGFQSTLLVPDVPVQLSTTKDVIESNLKILGVSDIITDAFPYFKKRYNLSSKRFRNRKLTYEDWIYRMTVKKDSAYLGFKETIRYHTKHTTLANKIYIPEHCVIKYLLAFVLKRNSHLSEAVVKFANRLNENGFLVHFTRKHLTRKLNDKMPLKLKNIIEPLRERNCNKLPPPINMDKMLVVFMCLLSGISLAFAAFLWELTSVRDWKKIKKKIFNNSMLGHTKADQNMQQLKKT